MNITEQARLDFENLEAELRRDEIEKIVTGSIIIKGNAFLMVKRADDDSDYPGLWELPSGGVDAGETFFEGLIRETKEETNLDVVEIEKYINGFDYRSGSGKMARQMNFLVLVDGFDVVLNPIEHSEYIWADRTTDLARYQCSEKMKDILVQIQENII